MRLPSFFLLVTTSALLPAADPDGFTPLFNGKNVTGWTAVAKTGPTGPRVDPLETWSVRDGELRCTGTPNGYLATDKEYSDYVLRVKWRYPAGAKAGNSGVLLHCAKADHRVWPNSVEAQMRAGMAGDIWLNGDEKDVLPKIDIPAAQFDTANKQKRHYFRLDREKVVEKPFGEWNEYEITCRGGDITLVVNGTTVNVAKGCSLTRGRIALQSEGAEVAFKDIAIKNLK